MARPVRKGLSAGDIGLHQRIRSQGFSLAKMEIRAPWVLIKDAVSNTTFRSRITLTPV